MPTLKMRSIKKIRVCVSNWMNIFTEHMDETSYICPDFNELMCSFVNELLTYTTTNLVYEYI
jgi:hypothetical protein